MIHNSQDKSKSIDIPLKSTSDINSVDILYIKKLISSVIMTFRKPSYWT